MRWLINLLAAAAIFAAGWYIGSKQTRPVAAVAYDEVKYEYVPVERLRVDTVYVPIEIEKPVIVEAPATEKDIPCVERVERRGQKLFLTTRVFNPKSLGYETRVHQLSAGWRLYGGVTVVPTGYTDMRLGYNFGRLGVEAVVSNRGLGLGVRVGLY